MKRSDQIRGIILVAISAIVFAVGPTAAKVAFNDGANALTVVTLRGIVGAIIILILMLALRQSLILRGAALRWTFFCGVFNTAMVYGLFASVQYIPIGVAILIFFAHPILIAIFLHFEGGDALTTRKTSYAILAFLGLALALAPAMDRVDLFGLSLAAMSTLGICGAIICGARAQKNATSSQVNFYVTIMSTAVYASAMLAFGAWSPPASSHGWLGICVAGVAVAVGLLTFFSSFRFLGPVRAAMLGNMEPILSIIVAAPVLGQTLSLTQWAGAAVMIAAIFLFEAQDLGKRRLLN
jgi:drug/metabolite transporter (DMT)-like permease